MAVLVASCSTLFGVKCFKKLTTLLFARPPASGFQLTVYITALGDVIFAPRPEKHASIRNLAEPAYVPDFADIRLPISGLA